MRILVTESDPSGGRAALLALEAILVDGAGRLGATWLGTPPGKENWRNRRNGVVVARAALDRWARTGSRPDCLGDVRSRTKVHRVGTFGPGVGAAVCSKLGGGRRGEASGQG